jgi:arginase
MKKICIIGVPMDFGASRRGVDMGPSAIRIAQVGQKLRAMGYDVVDRGNVEVQVRESLSEPNSKAKFRNEIAEILKRLKEMTKAAVKNGEIPLVLGGDHSIALGSVAGIAEHYHSQGKQIGVVWLDAHADINTPETTVSGNVHGMPVAHLMGLGDELLLSISSMRPIVDPRKVALVGLRDLDEGEKQTIKSRGVHAFTMRDIDELGMKEVMKRAIAIATQGTDGFHLSFDIDFMDPSVAPGVGTPVAGGATFREGHLAVEMASDSGKMISMEVTEVNPVLDSKNMTADLATGMILSAFGKRIL